MKSDLRKIGHILKQEGTSGKDRYLPALDPHSVLLDDRKLEDFIAYAQRYAKNLRFIEAESNPLSPPDISGEAHPKSWEPFFKSDIILLIANIATKNAGYFKTTYDLLYGRFQEHNTLETFKDLVEFTFSRFQKVNSWYYAANPGSSLHQELKLYIGSYLQPVLKSLQEIIFYLRQLERDNYRVPDFKLEFFEEGTGDNPEELLRKDNIWDLGNKENHALRERIFTGNNDVEKRDQAALQLNTIFDAIYHATAGIINHCQLYFEKHIQQQSENSLPQEHAPHVALLVAFLKLYGYLQTELNKLPQKHLDFYYREVLRIKAKEAIPDQTYVIFELAKGFDTYKIPPGTELIAGKDRQNKNLIYATNEELIINKTQVSAIHSVLIQRNKENQVLNYYTDALSPVATPEKTDKPDLSPSWKLFGESYQEKVAEIGFGLASTQFYLAKGERFVTVTLISLEPITGEQFDTSLLKLLLTGEKGWIQSDQAGSGINLISLTRISSQTLELNFKISLTQESAIIAFNNQLHTGDFRTSLPICQIILKYPPLLDANFESQPEETRAKIAQLQVLQNLRITGGSIRVEVGSLDASISFDGIRDLMLQNNESVLDPSRPFFPFSAIPKVGSAFYIGCKDFYYKKIDKLAINLAWMLPDNFNVYYSKYFPPYDSNKFIGSLYILRNKHWQKIKDEPVIDKDAREPQYKSIRLNLKKALSPTPEISPENAIPTADYLFKDGTLMVKLDYLDFGHSIYPQLITSAVIEKASSKVGAVDFYKLVKKQLQDSVISIKLPAQLEQRNGPFKVVLYDILDNVKDDDQARNLMLKGLSELIKRYNGSNVLISKVEKTAGDPATFPAGAGLELVNDDNFVQRVLGFLKKIKLINKTVYYDQDLQGTDQVVDAVKDKINSVADFILPSDKELISVIMNETNNAISKTVANVVDEILTTRQKGVPDPYVIAGLIIKEFEEANEVINDMIARKIALLLSAQEVPPPPYAPLINNISVSYTATKEMVANQEQFFHITPYGVLKFNLLAGSSDKDLQQENLPATTYIFPQSLVYDQDPPAEMAGLVFIGLRLLAPPQNLSLLWQVAEGTKTNDKKPPAVFWWYLQGANWRRLPAENLVSDSTYNLQTTGLLKFSLPTNFNNQAKLFNKEDLFWLVASVAKETEAFPKLVNITAQAAAVTFKDQGNDSQHLVLPLTAKSITNLVDNVPQIKKVSQPLSSFNGKVKEQDSEYYTRVSERLRHKGRAINNWDYERLILERYPSLFKVKCLNNYYAGRFAIGHVTVVPIPDLRNKQYTGSDLLIPKTNYIELKEIERFLQAKASPFLKVHALNPQLDQVHIRCKVKFYTGVDKGFYLQQLNEDLVKYLTPWADGDEEAINFSAKTYASSIINFIDQRPYVDYVAELVMNQFTVNQQGDKIYSVNEKQLTSLVETRFTTGHSILVSSPRHHIQLVTEKEGVGSQPQN